MLPKAITKRQDMNVVEELDRLDTLERMEKRAARFSIPNLPSMNLAKGMPSLKMPGGPGKPLTSVTKPGSYTKTKEKLSPNSAKLNPTMTSPQSSMGHQANRQVQPVPKAPAKPV